MAKISTYPNITPTLSDRIIGTDSTNNDETVNFLISDIVSLIQSNAYVPYTGAASDVDLGNNKLTAEQVIITGGGQLGTLSLTDITSNASFAGSVSMFGKLIDKDNYSGASGQVLTSTGNQVEWLTPANSLNDFGFFYNDTTQSPIFIASTAAQEVAFPIARTYVGTQSGISVQPNNDIPPKLSRITVSKDATYKIDYQLQVNSTHNQQVTITSFVKLMGSFVQNSRSQITLDTNHTDILSGSIILKMLANQYVSILYTTTDIQTSLIHIPALLSPNYPLGPSSQISISIIGPY